MKHFYLLFLIVLSGLTVRAQQADDEGDVVVSFGGNMIWGGYNASHPASGIIYCNAGGIVAQSTLTQTSSSPTVDSFSYCHTRMVPGVPYTIHLGTDNGVTPAYPGEGLKELYLEAHVPEGYAMVLKGSGQAPFVSSGPDGHMWFNPSLLTRQNGLDFTIVVRSLKRNNTLVAGRASALMIGRVLWQLSLGATIGGDSAGFLSFDDSAPGTAFGTVFSRANLFSDSGSSEVVTLGDASNSQVLRQIIAPQVCVDITGPLTAGSSFTINCYPPSQRSANVDSTGYFTFSGSPYVSYQVQPQGSDASGVIVTADFGQGAARVLTTKLTRTGTAPNYTWTADGWHTGSSAMVQTVRARSGSTETLSVKDGNGNVAVTSTRTYTAMLLTEEVTTEAAGTANPLTADYIFYNDGVGTSDPAYAAATALNWGSLRGMTGSGGKWANYTYNASGRVQTAQRPFNNSTASDSSSALTDSYTYQADALRFQTRVTSVSTTRGGTTLAQSTTAYADETPFSSFSSSHPNLGIVKATTTTNADSATSYTSIRRYFNEAVGTGYNNTGTLNTTTDDFFAGKIHSSQGPDGAKQSFVYQRGTWDGTTFTIASNAGLDVATPDSTTTASRFTTISGTANSSAGTAYSRSDSYPVDAIYLVDKKSTMQIAIYNRYADLVHTETQVWVNGTWNLVTSTNYTYTNAHQLSNRTSSNGGTWSANYSGERLTDSTDESGITVSLTYDAADRVDTATRTASGAIAALTTKFYYDAAGHQTQQVVGFGGTDSISTSQAFDDAGRRTSQSAPGPNGAITTSYAYTYGASTASVTATLPNGGTRTETYQADGNPSQVNGTGVIEQDYTYEVATGTNGAQLHTSVSIGGSSSSRKREAWTDWLGRTCKTSRPGFTGQSAFVTAHTYDPTTGLTTKTSRTGLADTLYQYDALSQLIRSGLDLDGSGALDLQLTDRVTDVDKYFQQIGGAWWLVKSGTAYPANNSNAALLVSTTRERLSGFPDGVQSETVSIDVDGNTVDRVVTVSRSTQTTTVTTTATGVANTQSETYVNGFKTNVTGFDGVNYTMGYDALGRQTTTTDPRTGTTTTAYYAGTAFVSTVKIEATDKPVATYTYDNAGRTVVVANANTKYSRTQYNTLDQVVRQWGDATYPVEYGYDPYGARTTMKTYRGGTGWNGATWPTTTGAGDWTLWVYDAPSGLLQYKYDAANLDSSGSPITGAHPVSFTYNICGQVATRTLARGVATTYSYDPNTGELLTQTYSDSTPTVTYTYTRTGGINTVSDATGQRTFNYGVAAASPASTPLQLDSILLGSFYGGRTLTRSYDSIHRPIGFKLGSTYNSAAELSQQYGFDASNGRFAKVVTAPGGQSGREFDYAYTTNGLVAGLSVASGSFSVGYDYEDHRNLRTKVDSLWGTVSRTRYDYTYNTLGQRLTAKQSCDLTTGAFGDFGDATTYSYVYNDRGELTDAADYVGSDVTVSANQMSGRHFAYAFDAVGNRTSSSRTGSAGAADTYAANSLNQYISRTNNYGHTAGTVAGSAVNVAIQGTRSATAAPAGRQGRYWDTQVTLDNANHPASSQLTVTATWPGHGSGGADLAFIDSTRTAFLAQALQSFSYDADGNLTGDGIWYYSYDAENRLVSMATTDLAGSNGFPYRALTFAYDYLGRRVLKRVFDSSNNNNVEIYSRGYLYDGNNLVAEFNAAGGTAVGSLLRSYTWGLDLAGSLTASGGVGALLQITEGTTSYLPTYDGNGNIASLLNASNGAVAASYEYSPSGELLRCAGTYAKTNPFRFSTKYVDDETSLVYYGARYYSPARVALSTATPSATRAD